MLEEEIMQNHFDPVVFSFFSFLPRCSIPDVSWIHPTDTQGEGQKGQPVNQAMEEGEEQSLSETGTRGHRKETVRTVAKVSQKAATPIYFYMNQWNKQK